MISLECFGRTVVFDESRAECSLRSRKHVGLLVYTVATPHTVHTRTDLAYLLWGGAGARERHSLSQALYDLRSRVGQVLDITTRTVHLRFDQIHSDARQFEKAVERGDYARALGFYRGEFCPNLANLGSDKFDRWLDGERERYRVLASLAMRNALRDAEQRADWDGMCLTALQLVRHNDLDEEAHVALMRGLWIKGDPASALLHAETLLERTSDEQWPLVAALANQIKCSGTPAEVLSIPRPPTPLIGRESEFKDIFRCLHLPRVGGRLVVITGERGVGKSCLLLELARCVEARGVRVRWIGRNAFGSTLRPRRMERESANKGPVIFLDMPPQGQLALLEDVVDTVAVCDQLAFLAVRKPLASQLVSRCDAVSTIHLNELSRHEVSALVAQHYPEMTAELIGPFATLAGGNPQLALAICRAWRPGLDGTVKRSLRCFAKELLERPSDLTLLLDDWLGELSPMELDLAALLAQAAPETRSIIEERLSEVEASGLASLRQRGLISRAGDLRFLHPIIQYTLELHSCHEGQARYRRVIAERCETGSLSARYAAALEYEQLGERGLARQIATAVARTALNRGNSALAAVASKVACRTAVTVSDRFAAGLLLAEAALTRGSATEAAAVLRTLEGLAPSREAALDVAIKLGKAAVAEGTVSEVARRLGEEDPMAHGVGDPVAAARAALELAQLRLGWAQLEEGPPQLELSRNLADRIRESRRMAELFPLTWIDSVRTLFGYYLETGSRAGARSMLAGHGDTLLQLGDPGAAVLSTCRAVLEMRAARLHAAERLLRDVVERRGAMTDRLQAVALNNLSVTLLESGRFDQAVAEVEKTVTLDCEVGLPGRDRVTAYMNRAQCAFFGGLADEAKVHCRLVSNLARCHGLVALEAQVAAISGLLALWSNRRRRADIEATRARELLPSLPMDADSYLVEWFVSAMRYVEEGREAAEGLIAAATRYEAIDRLAAAKLRMLAAGLSTEGLVDQNLARESVQTLRNGGCGWFVGFAAKRGVWTRRRIQRS